MIRQAATSNIFIIVDGEKYLTFSNDEMVQNVGFDKERALDNVKCKTKEKYPKNGLILSSKSISTAFLVLQKVHSAITAHIYINQCLSQLRSFIEEHHAVDEYSFWSDLASSHYANKTMHTMASPTNDQIRSKTS